MRILLIEPYYTGSHKSWAEGYQFHSQHDIEMLTLEGRYWKWRMHGGAISLADRFNKGNYQPDLILATDMLDLTTFLSLTRKKTNGIPVAMYFHENQLTYPWSENDRDIQAGRDNHYGFINYASALVADAVFFNSEYHINSFLGALPNFLKGFPDYNELSTIEEIRDKSQVLSLGLELARYDQFDEVTGSESPTLLWNHRWEYDKNPKDFFKVVYALKEENLDFKLIVLGENFSQQPEEFEEAEKRLSDQIIHYGYADNFDEYAQWMKKADIIPVTSNQDFFGGSIVEAIYCGVIPLLPNRLAYPQHVPESMKEALLYDDTSQLILQLKSLLSNYKSVDKASLKNHVSGYDWARISLEYDQALSSLRLPK